MHVKLAQNDRFMLDIVFLTYKLSYCLRDFFNCIAFSLIIMIVKDILQFFQLGEKVPISGVEPKIYS